MKKKMVWLIALALLPVLTVGLECMPDSVMVFDGTETTYYSYFDLMPEGITTRLLTPLTGLMTIVAFIITVLYVITRKNYWLTGLKWNCLLAACVAAIPIVVRTESFVVPTVFVPILLIAEAVLCVLYLKKGMFQEDGKPAGRRLKR